MTTHTAPGNARQFRIFSNAESELAMYPAALWLLQLFWAVLDYPGYVAFFNWLFESVPSLLSFVPFLAVALILGLHSILRATLLSYCLNKHDDDPETNFPIWIPVVVSVFLIAGSIYGIRVKGESMIAPPVEIADAVALDQHSTAFEKLKRDHDDEAARIEAAFDKKTRAITNRAGSKLNEWDKKRKSAISDNDLAWISKNQNTIAAAAEREVKPIEKEKGNKLLAIAEKFERESEALTARKSKKLDAIDARNSGEKDRHSAAMTWLGKLSWVASVLIAVLFFAGMNRLYALRKLCGIQKEVAYSVIKQSGGLLGLLGNVLADAGGRQFYRLSVWLHSILTKGTHRLGEVDSFYAHEPIGYNQIRAGFAAASRPQEEQKKAVYALEKKFREPFDSEEQKLLKAHLQEKHAKKSLAQAAAEVAEKLKSAGVTDPAPDSIQKELAKSLASNGAYPSMPLEPEFSEKKPDGGASPQTSAAEVEIRERAAAKSDADETVPQPKSPPTVPQPSITVAQQNVPSMSDDEFLDYRRKEIQKWHGHFERRDASSANAAGVAHKNLDLVVARAKGEWKPTRLAAQNFNRWYFDVLEPKLKKAGFEYPNEDALLAAVDFQNIETAVRKGEEVPA